MISHRGTEFREILAEIARQLRPIFGTNNAPLLFGCSGTGVMEAALVNVLLPGESGDRQQRAWGERFRPSALRSVRVSTPSKCRGAKTSILACR
jgi:aspartate aminotransferase-like enzyme